jgi:hypothetical protein
MRSVEPYESRGFGLTLAKRMMVVNPRTIIPAATVKRMILLFVKALATSVAVGIVVYEPELSDVEGVAAIRCMV